MKQVKIPKQQTPTDYLVVRVELVHVKKGWFGLRDKQLTAHSAIPDTPQQAVDLTNKISLLMNKTGIAIPLEEEAK